MQLLVRNRVKDFATWHALFLADRIAAAGYGLTFVSLWQTLGDPNNVFFILDVEDIDLANAFMARPESQALGIQSGVIEGEFHYLEAVA